MFVPKMGGSFGCIHVLLNTEIFYYGNIHVVVNKQIHALLVLGVHKDVTLYRVKSGRWYGPRFCN